METSEISEHQLRVFLFVQSASGWVTSKQVAEGANVAQRTARGHLRHFVLQGIFDVAEIFPGHRYKLSEQADKRNPAYMLRLEKAKNVLGW